MLEQTFAALCTKCCSADKTDIGFLTSLTQHSFAGEAAIFWKCSAFQQSGHSEGQIGQSQTAHSLRAA